MVSEAGVSYNEPIAFIEVPKEPIPPWHLEKTEPSIPEIMARHETKYALVG